MMIQEGPSAAPVLVELKSISKSFGATRALADVSVCFRRGEVHALVGENGAGKSTLGKIVLGVHDCDGGSVTLDGSTISFDSPADAANHGIVGVAQELSLLPAMTVVDNIVLGSEERVGPVVNGRANRRRVDQLIAKHGLSVDPSVRVSTLSVADQQKVEILRALGRNARLVVFDEPTARLASHEALELRSTIRDLAETGTTVIYISHFLDEVLAVSDTISIMRDGQLVRTSAASLESHDSLVEAMMGRSLDDVFPPKRPKPAIDAPVVLDVEGLSRPGEFEDVTFTVGAGEIVGLAGLVGAGRSEVAHTIYGSTRPSNGTVKMSGADLNGGVRESLDLGMALIPESRRDQGLVIGRSVQENTSLPHLRRFAGWLGMKNKAERVASLGACDSVGVKTHTISAPMSSLSGGNQQKVLFARTVLGAPKLVIADEPTRGVDVGAKRGIYEVLARLAADGCAVLLISSELEEIVGLSHRVLVMHQGRISAEFNGEDLDENKILAAAFGTTAVQALVGEISENVVSGPADEAGNEIELRSINDNSQEDL